MTLQPADNGCEDFYCDATKEVAEQAAKMAGFRLGRIVTLSYKIQ